MTKELEVQSFRDKLVELWSDLPGLRAAAQLIPGGIGGAIDLLIMERMTRIEQQRLAETLKLLDQDIKVIGARNLDKPFLASEECHDFLRRGADAARRARGQEHRVILARVMASGMTGRMGFEQDPTTLMQALGELGPDEVELLGIIFRFFKEHGEEGRLEESVLRTILPAEWTGSVQFFLKRVERTGLIAQYVGSGAVGDNPGGYELTSMGGRLRDIVQADL